MTATEELELYWIDVNLPGDANGDGVFDSAEANSTFETGDWNGDGEFNSSDLVAAFQAGYQGEPLG